MPIAYTSKINQRSIGAELLIINEAHVVGITAVATVSANQIRLYEVPLQESPSSVAIPGYAEVLSAPGTNEFRVDYTNGRITFNITASGSTVFVTYKGRGSIVDAEDVNELQQVFIGAVNPGNPTIGIANLDGTLSDGIVRPNNISTVATDDFLFPNHVVITGDLTVNGTTTTINTDTVTIEDNVILLNSNVVSAPSFDAGIEVERGTSPNVQLIWDETDDAWSLNNTSGNPILEAFDTGVVYIPGTLSLVGPLYLGDGTVGVPAYTFTSDTDTGLYRIGSNDLGITTGGSLKLEISTFVNSAVDFSVSRSNSGNAVISSTSNQSNTASSSATSIIQVAGSTAFDPSLLFRVFGVTNWSMGIDNSDSDALKIAHSSALDTATAITIDTSLNVGLGVTPVAKLHIGGSTVFGLTTDTNPVSIPTATVDSNSGIVITTTSPIAVTLGTPTNTTEGRFFTILHNDTSTGSLTVNSQSMGIGKGSSFIWDGTVWIPVGGAGSFNLVAGNPGSPQTGDTWFNTTTSQFMGYNGSTNVILG